ncbi:carnitine o-octanoyltransferase [Plakobranchus ocellatus]|uniref:Carnitine o-octanoyltransferase n=1 Tax=Plakobranchus ocellatus TaxID=259542 RepID=A0AAV4C9P9_9GAST|nr:carnitine o-octanoyltransferase [Plakobranchus ocellatus]
MATIEDEILSKDETTFQYENDLLTLPVPDLLNTLQKYLASVRPVVTDEEFKTTEAIVKQFAEGEGLYLQQLLIEFAEGKRNWLEKWWEDTSYLEMRGPAPLINMGGCGKFRDVWPAQEGTQIPRAAAFLYYCLKFWEYTRKEMHKPGRIRTGLPISMDVYKRIFNTVKVPGVDKDELVQYFKTEKEGDCPTHVVVMSKGHIFCLEMFGEDGELLTPPEIEVQLEKIKTKSNALGPAQGVAYLTSMDRRAWAEARGRLIKLHPQNEETLQAIQESIMALWLEDGNIGDDSHLAQMSLLGNGENRWFDKSYSGGIYENGLPISNADSDGQVRSLPEPKHLQFVLDGELLLTINKAKADYAALTKRANVAVRDYTKGGKKFCKAHGIHPDALCQMAIQLAYFRLHKRLAPTTETAPARQFYRGRTGAMRSCTKEVLDWCTAMDDPKIAVDNPRP